MDNRLKILGLTRYTVLGASSRIRFYQYIPALRALDLELEVSPLLRDEYVERLYEKQATNWSELLMDYLTRIIQLFRIRSYDLIWIEKELFPNLPAWFERMLGRMEIPYVVDYDDAVFHNYDSSQQLFKRYLGGKIDEVMRNASLVTCGNSYLAGRAHTAGAQRVEILPTVIDLERYSVTVPESCDLLVVGWIGSPSTVKYLDVVAEPLKELAKECRLQVRVIGAQFASTGLDVVCVPWSETTEVNEIQKFDIGVMPLVDSPWERGKCGYKLIQYMACGLPVVASPVGVNQEIVENGVNGYLAKTSDDWLKAFRLLGTDAAFRRDMGARGRFAVEQKYCLQVAAPHVVKLFRQVLAQRVLK